MARTAFSIAAAASNSPRWRSIITADRISAVGLMTFLPAYFGAEPCTASKIATSLPRFADGAKPSPPTSAARQVGQDVAVHVRRDDHVELLGRFTSWWAQLSMMRCCASMSGYSGAISSKVRLSIPSVIFMMFDFVAQWTVVRPSARASSNARRTIFSQPLREMSLRRLRDAGRLHVLDAGVEVLDVLADDHEVDASAEYGVATPGSSRAGRTFA